MNMYRPLFIRRTPRPTKRLTGFTLLETIVALALIVAAAIGPITLAAQSLFSAKFARSRIIALNLAQEGVEIARTMRDNNLLLDCTFRGNGSTGCATLADGSYEADIFSSDLAVSSAQKLLYATNFGIYAYAANDATVVSPYTRTIAISTPTIPPAPSGTTANDAMLVTSTVTWTEAGLSRQAQVQEILFNWK